MTSHGYQKSGSNLLRVIAENIQMNCFGKMVSLFRKHVTKMQLGEARKAVAAIFVDFGLEEVNIDRVADRLRNRKFDEKSFRAAGIYIAGLTDRSASCKLN